jgi:circadian clock protein KaiC
VTSSTKATLAQRARYLEITKVPTGVKGLDEILNGGLPQGRPTLLCGGAGCGKTLLATEFLCRGAVDYAEPGIFIAFEERAEELAANVASLGFDLPKMEEEGLLVVDYVAVSQEDLVQTGEFDLGGLFLRIAESAKAIGAKRIVIDTIEVLFGSLKDSATLRAELARLFRWLKDQGLTAIVTAERGEGTSASRNGVEEYVSDCVILLDHRITDERSTRRLRVLKYRGALHGTDEYPFLISNSGFRVLPVSSLGLEQTASSERISTGIERLDDMLSGGVYQGSSVLISGMAGAGKTILAASFADAACRRGEKTLFVSYEESAGQIKRNVGSVGIDLEQWTEKGLLRIESLRPNLLGLEAHLAWLTELLDDFQPSTFVVDPITGLLRVGSKDQVAATLLREVDMLKSKGISALFTALTVSGASENTDVEVSSLIDTWIMASTDATNGERNRVLSIIKSRGMSHSNQLTEFVLSDHGVEILEPYVGPAGVLTGSARMVQEAADWARHNQEIQNLEDKRRFLDQRKEAIEAQITALWADHTAEEIEFNRVWAGAEAAGRDVTSQRGLIGSHRWATSTPGAIEDSP